MTKRKINVIRKRFKTKLGIARPGGSVSGDCGSDCGYQGEGCVCDEECDWESCWSHCSGIATTNPVGNVVNPAPSIKVLRFGKRSRRK